MKATVTYNTINGKIYSETRNGVSTAFVSDPLGNVIKCRDSDGNQTYEAWYWPYGEIRESSGTNPSPWGFVGLLGYYTDALNFLYVRARYYRPNLTRWQTVDPLWPKQLAYIYSESRPVDFTDKYGLGVNGNCLDVSGVDFSCVIDCMKTDVIPPFLIAMAYCISLGGWLCGLCMAAALVSCVVDPATCAAAVAVCAAICGDAFSDCAATALLGLAAGLCVCINHCRKPQPCAEL